MNMKVIVDYSLSVNFMLENHGTIMNVYFDNFSIYSSHGPIGVVKPSYEPMY